MQTGTVIFWNGRKGIIRNNENGKTASIFRFLIPDSLIYQFKLLAQFSYEVEYSKEDRRTKVLLKKYNGYRVPEIVKDTTHLHQHNNLVISKVTSWDGRKGILATPVLEDEIFLFHTRLQAERITVGDLLLIHPVVSKTSHNDNPNFKDLFADYALLVNDPVISPEIWQIIGGNHENNTDNGIASLFESKRILPIQKSSQYQDYLNDGRIKEALEEMQMLCSKEDSEYVHWLSLQPLHLYKFYWLKGVASKPGEKDLLKIFIASNHAERFDIVKKLSISDKHELFKSSLEFLIQEKMLKAHNALFRFILLNIRTGDEKNLDYITLALEALSSQDKLSLVATGLTDFDLIKELPFDEYFADSNKCIRLLKPLKEKEPLLFFDLKTHLIEKIKHLPDTNDEWERLFKILEEISGWLSAHEWQLVFTHNPNGNLWLAWYISRSTKAIHQPVFIDQIIQSEIKSTTSAYFIDYIIQFAKGESINEDVKKSMLNWVLKINKWNGYFEPSLILKNILDKEDFERNAEIIQSVLSNSELSSLLKIRLFNAFPSVFTDHNSLYYELREAYYLLDKKEKHSFRNLLSHDFELEAKETWGAETSPVFNDKESWERANTIVLQFSNFEFENGAFRILIHPDAYLPLEGVYEDSKIFEELNSFRQAFKPTDVIHFNKNELLETESIDLTAWLTKVEYLQLRKVLTSGNSASVMESQTDAYIKNYLQESALYQYASTNRVEEFNPISIDTRRKKRNNEPQSIIITIQTELEDIHQLLWIQPEIESGNAVYVFNSSSSATEATLNNLVSTIKSTRNLKSLLIAKESTELANLIKRKLAYVGRVKFNRKDQIKAGQWKEKLIDLGYIDPPLKLSKEDETQLNNLLESNLQLRTGRGTISKESLIKQDMAKLNSINVSSERGESISNGQKTKLMSMIELSIKELNAINELIALNND